MNDKLWRGKTTIWDTKEEKLLSKYFITEEHTKYLIVIEKENELNVANL